MSLITSAGSPHPIGKDYLPIDHIADMRDMVTIMRELLKFPNDHDLRRNESFYMVCQHNATS